MPLSDKEHSLTEVILLYLAQGFIKPEEESRS